MWIDERLLAAPLADGSRRGRPCLYCDTLIQGLLALKQVFRLTQRAWQGFAQSLALADLALPIPESRTPLHQVMDSTGLKLYGEGEWKMRKHGWAKRRT